MKFKSFSVIPGFGWTFGLGAGYFSVLVLLPFAALIAYGCGIRPSAFAKALGDGEILSALGLSLRAALVAGLINLVFGFILAWSIERYRFPGRSLLDSLVDIPFALPTAVAGVSISFLLSDDGYIGKLVNQFGFSLSGNDFTGITFALVFVGIPFVVRTLQPVIKRLDASTEEAAEILGATPPPDLSPRDIAAAHSPCAHRLLAGVRARGRRVRLGHLRLEQPAVQEPDPACRHCRQDRVAQL